MGLRILRLPEVLERIGLCRSTLYNRILAGEFPGQISLGGRAVGWIEAEVDAWLERQVALTREPPPKKTRKRGRSSGGRASRSQREGREFNSPRLHARKR